MRFDNPFEVVRTLDGPALKVLWVLVFARKQGMPIDSEMKLQTLTGLSRNTARKGAAQLELYGLVRRNGRYGPYVLTGEAVQLPLISMLLEAGGEVDAPSVDNEVASQPLIDSMDNAADPRPRESQKLTLPDGTTTTYLHSRESEGNEEVVVSKGVRESKFDSRVQKNIAMLRKVGIKGRVAEELAALDYVTPEYVGALAGTLRKSDTVGLLVRKIRDHDPMPRQDMAGAKHPRGCECSECRRRYITGEYADFIEH